MKMTAEEAYAEADFRIGQARRRSAFRLNLTDLKALETIPALNGLSSLRRLYLKETKVSDLSPLQKLGALEVLYINNTMVSDLRPIAGLFWEFETDKLLSGVHFKNTPATIASPELAALAEIENDRERTDKTLAYLRSLPPYPDPLPWEGSAVIAAAPAAVTTAQTHIAFLLEHAALNYVHAQTTAGQIKAALRDVPASNGNHLAPLLQLSYDFATVLDHLGAQSDAATDERQRLLARIAELEGIVQMLTAGLKDKAAMTEAANILPEPENGFAKSYKTASGEELAKFQFFLAKTGIITSAIHFLGNSSPLVTALLTALK